MATILKASPSAGWSRDSSALKDFPKPTFPITYTRTSENVGQWCFCLLILRAKHGSRNLADHYADASKFLEEGQQSTASSRVPAVGTGEWMSVWGQTSIDTL